MDNIERAAAAFKFVVTPKLRTACSGCMGYVTTCRYCSRKVEFRDSKCFDYRAGTLHRCGYGRY